MTSEQQDKVVRHFDLGPTQLTVEAENVGLMGGFERFLGERGQPGVAGSTFLVSIRVDEPEPVPADAELLYSGALPNEGTCDFARIGQTYFMSFPGEARMVVDPQARRADIVVSRDRPQRARGSVVPISVEFALDLEDQQVLHAAGLSLPAEGGMVLVSAPSGTGKTTTSLALARCGLSFAADDIMVLRREPGSIVAWGLPRALNVHRNTAAMQPWLNLQPQWNAEGEQAVPRRSLASGVQLEDRELPVTRLVLLQRGERTKMEPLGATDMLAALAADNVRNSTSGLTPLQGRRFAMLADLVRAVPAYKVTMAAGLSDIEVIASELAR